MKTISNIYAGAQTRNEFLHARSDECMFKQRMTLKRNYLRQQSHAANARPAIDGRMLLRIYIYVCAWCSILRLQLNRVIMGAIN
jgi:hypothetical protein